ncbi:kinesin protein KIN-7O [Trifolium repens]|nr:kinesin protein KIN-7O [Trifolium repens]
MFYEEHPQLNEELIKAQEAARVASEQLISSKTVSNINDGNVDFIKSVSVEIEDIMSEVQNSKEAVQSVILMVDDATKSFSTLFHMFLDFKASISQDSVEQKSIVSNYQKLTSCLRQTISELENEKILLDNQLANIQKLLQKSELDAQSSHNSFLERLGQQELENGELLSYIQTLEKEISSSSVAKEKETLRRDLEKAKTRLKETESKLKISMQEKTKLESEKAGAEREIKRLHGQNSLLERDISKRDSLAGRRRDSIAEKSSKMFDPQRPKGPAFSLEEHKKLEVFAFESETRIASLEEEITAALKEKEEVISFNEALNSELEDLTEKLSTSASEIYDLKEEISALKQRLEESDLNQEKFKSSITVLMEEKEELAMQLTDALLEIEEERAIWSAKEKDALLAIEEQARSNNEHVTSLSTELSEVRKELESYREECRIFRERLTISYENMLGKEKFRENVLDLDHLETINVASKQQTQEELHDCPENVDGIQRETQVLNKGDHLPNLRELDTMSEIFIEFQNLKSQLSTVTEERDKLTTQMEDEQKHVMEVELLLKHCQDELSSAKDHIEELSRKISSIEVKIHVDKVTNTNETAKLRMRLRGTQAKLDAFRLRYKEAIDESASLKIKYREASEKLKDMLASQGLEVLSLKKQLAAAKEQ